MNGIEKITGQIAVDAQKEIDALLQQARDQAAQTAAGYEAQAASQSQAILERGEQEARRRKERLIDWAGPSTWPWRSSPACRKRDTSPCWPVWPPPRPAPAGSR